MISMTRSIGFNHRSKYVLFGKKNSSKREMNFPNSILFGGPSSSSRGGILGSKSQTLNVKEKRTKFSQVKSQQL